MKIYDKRAFAMGLLCAGSIPLLILDIIPSDPLQWVLSLTITGHFLYMGLSKEESEKEQAVGKYFKETAVSLHGKYYFVKTNLPLILLAAFFVPALLLRWIWDIVLPVWVAVVFVMVLTVSVAYSIGINRQIREHIDQRR